jgi:anti-sigma factor RsiW
MNCADVRPVLQIYIDNEVSALDARPIEEHLRGCSECRDQAQFYHRQDALLREAVTSIPLEADLLRQRIHRQIAAQQWSAMRTWAIAAAALLVVAFGTLAAYRLVSAPSTPDPFYQAATSEHMRAEADHTEGQSASDVSTLVASYTEGRTVDVNIPTMRLVNGHPCEVEEVGTAHLLYIAPDGRMVSVYLCAKRGVMPKGAETISTADGSVELASIDGRTVGAVDVAGVRRIVVGDGFSRDEILATLHDIR